jgi:hypothetical protein
LFLLGDWCVHVGECSSGVHDVEDVEEELLHEERDVDLVELVLLR